MSDKSKDRISYLVGVISGGVITFYRIEELIPTTLLVSLFAWMMAAGFTRITIDIWTQE